MGKVKSQWSEEAQLRSYASKRHAEHRAYDEWCRHCKQVRVHDFGRTINVMPERSACCHTCKAFHAQQGA